MVIIVPELSKQRVKQARHALPLIATATGLSRSRISRVGQTSTRYTESSPAEAWNPMAPDEVNIEGVDSPQSLDGFFTRSRANSKLLHRKVCSLPQNNRPPPSKEIGLGAKHLEQ